MAWLVVAGNVYSAIATDRSMKLALLILIAVCLPIAVTRIRQQRPSPRPAGAPSGLPQAGTRRLAGRFRGSSAHEA